MGRNEIMDMLADNQRRVERILQASRMDHREGADTFVARADNLADALYLLRDSKDIKLVSLRAQANDLIKQSAKLHADYFEFDRDPRKYIVQEREDAVERRGGKREGAGRKSIGIKKPVMITLPQEDWDTIDSLISSGQYKGYADYFRTLHQAR